MYDVAVALVWVKRGAVADNRNEAYALASCRSCTTVAVAFQVLLVVGHNDAVAPVNAAVAANGACVECLTTAWSSCPTRTPRCRPCNRRSSGAVAVAVAVAAEVCVPLRVSVADRDDIPVRDAQELV